ncbi:hypothetical protein SAMN02746041_01976 [Desulfacinum hydrothermale DSM 13146]|uniref:Uncharacterized protein n=1 Tax=Desulfacinum hydrothermale DSM 13146 TaxID=1121390 RepID=A0A1W1XKN6_9BACT|nr:hypothetical protein [Desulfacinum hydrothermale]SMC24377.1 hypothetical protein SAMN02746041_01976 [Desulfacinum hydrothermale DSM 13146]
MGKLMRLCIFMMLVVLFFHVPLRSATLDPEKFLPIKHLYTDQELQELFYNMHFRPLERDDLAFSMLVPKDWEGTPIRISKEELGQESASLLSVAKLIAPEEEKGLASIEVWYCKLPFEVNIKDWVDFYLKGSGLQVLLRRVGTYNGRKVEEVLARFEQEGQSYLARLTFSRHGSRLFLIACSALETSFQHYARVFSAAAISFTVKRNATSEFAEPMKIYGGKRAPVLRFRYPASWTAKEPDVIPKGKSGVDISLRKELAGGQARTLAFLHIKGISKTLNRSPDDIVEGIKKDMMDAGIKLQGSLEETEITKRFSGRQMKAKRWSVLIGGEAGELAVAVFAKHDAHIAMGLLVPSPMSGPLAWMAGYRELEIAARDLLAESLAEKGRSPSEAPIMDPKKLVNETMYLLAEAIKSGNFAQFHKKLTMALRKGNTPQTVADNFKSFVEKKIDLTVIEGLDPILENEPQIKPDQPLELKGKYYASLMTVIFDLTYKPENSEWKLSNISVRTGPPQPPPGKKLEVPSRRELIRLTNNTMHTLADSINRNDFTPLYNHIAQIWQKEVSNEGLADMFSSFVENKVDLGVVRGQNPIFDNTAHIEEGQLFLNGHYQTESMKVFFELKYWMEGETWKLVGIHVWTEK